jgi:uncharacterized protein YecE (DUF72 family)
MPRRPAQDPADALPPPVPVGPPAPAGLYVGTSGYAFDAWKGPFYPADLSDKAMLGYYAARLGSVEINYTFRHHPSTSTMAGWMAATPATFRFSVKAHQRITHTTRLKDLEPALYFVSRVVELGDRLGPVLVQCPPNMKLDRPRLEAFLAGLPSGPRYAFEFRHPSWTEARELLLGSGAAVVVSDTDEEPLPDAPLDAGRFVYMRLRKTAYDEAALDRWASRIGEALAKGTEVYCYFKHEDDGLGPKLALSTIERVRALTKA